MTTITVVLDRESIQAGHEMDVTFGDTRVTIDTSKLEIMLTESDEQSGRIFDLEERLGKLNRELDASHSYETSFNLKTLAQKAASFAFLIPMLRKSECSVLIEMIKTLRTATDCGLKDGKEAVEAAFPELAVRRTGWIGSTGPGIEEAA